MLLSGLGLVAVYAAVVPWSGTHLAQGPNPGSSSELPFLEDGWKSGQGKGYLWGLASPRLVGGETLVNELIATSPGARRFFPGDAEISDLFTFILARSHEYDVPPLMALSLIEIESGFRPWAVSRRGAVGLMQLLPATAEELARDSGIIWYPELLQDPKVNIELGLRYISKLRGQFGSWDRALTAYNIGPAALQDKLDTGEAFSTEYVRRVKGRAWRYGRTARIPRPHSRLWAKAWL